MLFMQQIFFVIEAIEIQYTIPLPCKTFNTIFTQKGFTAILLFVN